jgi:aminoglycoside 6'-N-acetyltransferase I
MKIEDLDPDDDTAIEQVAALLVDFAPNKAAAWPDLEAAKDTVEEALDEDSIALVALNDAGNVIGFAAAAPQYSHAWELHPIVVDRGSQRQGVGRALLDEIERLAAEEDGLTVYLGADDIDGDTNLADEELFPDVLDHAKDVAAKRHRHPIGFFQHLGYEVVGLIPDANGPGRPDIWLARSIADLAEGDDE